MVCQGYFLFLIYWAARQENIQNNFTIPATFLNHLVIKSLIPLTSIINYCPQFAFFIRPLL